MGSFFAWIIGLGLFVCGVLYVGVVDVWTVPSDDPALEASLVPALKPGDVVLLARHGEVSRGNLARCPDPQAEGRFVIGRQVAEAREVVDIVNDMLSIDGRPVVTPHICTEDKVVVKDPVEGDEVTLKCFTEKLGEWSYDTLRGQPPTKMDATKTHETVDPGKVFLVSDDRHFHLDSRDFGAVPAGSCVHIVFRLWGRGGFFDPQGRFSLIW